MIFIRLHRSNWRKLVYGVGCGRLNTLTHIQNVLRHHIKYSHSPTLLTYKDITYVLYRNQLKGHIQKYILIVILECSEKQSQMNCWYRWVHLCRVVDHILRYWFRSQVMRVNVRVVEVEGWNWIYKKILRPYLGQGN